jgi:hypothetical protein
MRFSLFAFGAALFSTVLASNVLELNPDNFDEYIGKGKPALVELCVANTFALLKCAHEACHVAMRRGVATARTSHRCTSS